MSCHMFQDIPVVECDISLGLNGYHGTMRLKKLHEQALSPFFVGQPPHRFQQLPHHKVGQLSWRKVSSWLINSRHRFISRRLSKRAYIDRGEREAGEGWGGAGGTDSRTTKVPAWLLECPRHWHQQFLWQHVSNYLVPLLNNIYCLLLKFLLRTALF